MEAMYLGHSGFAVEIGEALLAFDVCEKDGAQLLADRAAAAQRSVLMLSHSHHDHWCKEVVALPFADVLLSEDFPASVCGERLEEGAVWEKDGVVVRTFGSTDMGLSFLVDVGGKRIFHAGDYNLWHWEDESTKEEIAEATEWFERILSQMQPFAGSVDAAFFPLDPRMGKNTARGIKRFMEVMQPKAVVPMHFWNQPQMALEFAKAHDNVKVLTEIGEKITL